MAGTVTIDLRHVVRGLDIPLPQVQAVVELLDEGNTVPFITRYRKDRTGGLDEEQVRLIQGRLTKARFLAERKQTILRSIEAQGKLTEKLAGQIQGASTTKRLEDLYLPYKPKKQTLATVARSRGLEPLAREILEADPLAANLDARAADFVNSDKQVPTAAEALLGAGHILAEQISERAELRQRLREILQRSGRLVSSGIGADAKPLPEAGRAAAADHAPQDDSSAEEAAAPVAPASMAADTHVVVDTLSAIDTTTVMELLDAVVCTPTAEEPAAAPGEPAACDAMMPAELASIAAEPIVVASMSEVFTESLVEPPAAPLSRPAAPRGQPRKARPTKAERKAEEKKRKDEQKHKAFSDYFDYREEIKRIPPHRILAINRGERARVLRVKIEADLEAMDQALDELVVPAEHPHAALLRGCARDALSRLIVPSLEREIRRELTEKAENHAVGVFARNLRNLLLQPPIRDRRTLAIDPGFKSGCKLVALDQFGNVLDQGMMYLVGKDDRRQEAAQKIVDLVTRHELQVIVIGNGTGCREAEDFVGNLIGTQLVERGVAYVIVNEAGASVYSTSRVGREEFPQYDASLRGAISIGRRLQDPLSELVKIDAANIGVGLYQHDVKAKHLRASLDDVVESCVNFVGVDVNTASPALLRYVSGLNQLTARRLYEHRRQNGPFRSREQLKDVPGFGESTFVQAAGFLKIVGGDNPFDATWIHPESYAVTRRLLEKLECTAGDLSEKEGTAKLAERTAKVDLTQMAQELDIGTLTLKDILAQLIRPGRDPREDLPKPVFKQGVLKLEDLAPGMELTGTILNVVDFGAFVDIGVHHSGLIHVSQLADKYIRDPHEVVAVGDIVKVWVLEVDKQRRRVSLTMIPPGTERQHGRRPPKPEAGESAPPQREQRPRSADRRPPRPRSGGPPRGKAPPPTPHVPPPKPRPPKKPLVPITEEMKAGKAPLRTFGDLMQFFELQQDVKKSAATDPEPPPPPSDGAPPA